MLAVLWLVACRSQEITVGSYTIDLHEDGSFTALAPGGQSLSEVRLLSGAGSYSVETQFGAFWFSEETLDLSSPAAFGKIPGDATAISIALPLRDEEGEVGSLVLVEHEGALTISFQPSADHDRIGFSARCEPKDRFLGAGSHAMDLDHRGESFALWTSEPGIGKTSTDVDKPPGWPVEGTKHATSYPAPWLLRPGGEGRGADGILFDTAARLELDLCGSDPDRIEMIALDEGAMELLWLPEDRPLQVVRSLTDHLGRAPLPQPWVFGAWGDAIRGSDRVRTVRDTLRAQGIPATLLWSEDWKGAEETPTGYRLGEEWSLDRDIYPDAEELAASLEEVGLKWLAYFAPFLGEGTETYEEALAEDVIVKDAAGEPYLFPGVTLRPTGLLDVTTDAGQQFAVTRMRAALDLGFDGWMADYGEWLPTDAAMGDGSTGLQAHARYPELWQQINREAQEGYDATFFVRSGWTRTASGVPVVWAGDQRTSFDPDDGMPTVLPLGLGLSMSGVPVFTHDVAGYQSVGNPPSTKELWFRWASLGAYSPIYRLHHGSFDTDNHQFDTDPDTLAHYTATTREHVRLFPYRYALAAQAARDGTPMILPVGFVFDGEDPARMDAWMLGPALLVAPVMEEGATGREVSLPEGVRFWRWPELSTAQSGYQEAPLGEIPVFAAEGTTVPTFATVPDTLVAGASGLVTLEEADKERVVYLIGGGGDLVEADGTRYLPSGSPTGPGELTVTLTAGTLELSGVTIEVSGPIERTYRFVIP